jgi:hypothetical protein
VSIPPVRLNKYPPINGGVTFRLIKRPNRPPCSSAFSGAISQCLPVRGFPVPGSTAFRLLFAPEPDWQ